ncbi:PilZ domain-containing protein [Desulfofustis glycolicus]|uniref:PilZ domain-containing protein n=1 Tax=Desulfofustis glycolicus DSM 9705 TaxID=1121409 RepID=A0A1M5S803_9BACT|nr:PilZ domain-containing protein [Desulfofustis glycolicus]MCB2216219.1 PilZ domain-containing protein [Desulfobulbaceae bacterium]SHH34575.1 PilZ domain-containing protein [Desulfofustis glycolicus DSM 9705]
MRKAKKTKKADKRKVQRWHLVFYLRVFDGQSQTIVGHLVDISSRGLMLVCDKPVERGRALTLRMKLPKELAGRQEILFDAVCRWCRQDSNPDFYIAGFKLAAVPDDISENLRQLVGEFSIEESLKTVGSECPACSLTHTSGTPV